MRNQIRPRGGRRLAKRRRPMLGVVLVVAITFIIINIIVDMLYILIDPRIRTV